MAIVTKSDIKNGINITQEFTFEKLGGELKIRELRDGERHNIEKLAKNGGLKQLKGTVEAGKRAEKGDNQKNDIGYEIDPMKSADSRYDADVKAVYYALKHDESTENWTENDIKEWPAGAVEEVALKVYEISGMEDPNETRKEVEDFREDESESSD